MCSQRVQDAAAPLSTHPSVRPSAPRGCISRSDLLLLPPSGLENAAGKDEDERERERRGTGSNGGWGLPSGGGDGGRGGGGAGGAHGFRRRD